MDLHATGNRLSEDTTPEFWWLMKMPQFGKIDARWASSTKTDSHSLLLMWNCTWRSFFNGFFFLWQAWILFWHTTWKQYRSKSGPLRFLVRIQSFRRHRQALAVRQLVYKHCLQTMFSSLRSQQSTISVTHSNLSNIMFKTSFTATLIAALATATVAMPNVKARGAVRYSETKKWCIY